MALGFPKGRILCTEDDADTRDMLVIILGREGYDVVCTESAEDALRLAKSERFDLFLVDSWMPGMSGTQLTEEVRKFNIKTPILFYSGVGEQRDKDEAQLAGAQGYLVKPTAADELIDEIVRLIAEARIAYPVEIVVP